MKLSWKNLSKSEKRNRYLQNFLKLNWCLRLIEIVYLMFYIIPLS